MPYNEPDDALTYDFDSSDEEYAEHVEAEIRSALIRGWSETDDGQHETPKEAFAQWLVDCADADNVKTYHYQLEMLGYDHEDVRNARADLVNEFMDWRAEL